MITPPPILKGDELNQIKQLRSYLYQISQQLTDSLIQIESGNIEVQPSSALAKSVLSSSAKEINDAAGNLKSLIIKNADYVKSEMDRITTELNSTYEAVSEFGSFASETNTTLDGTADQIEMLINNQSTINGNINTLSADLNNYIVHTSGFIKAGIVDYDGAIPIIGIAIGQNIKTTGTQDVDGTSYDIIEKDNMTIWTTEKLGFWINGVEVAYFANDMLYVTSVKVSRNIDFGDDWEISYSATEGFSIDWIGDE